MSKSRPEQRKQAEWAELRRTLCQSTAEAAAASLVWVGKGDKNAADDAAVEAMRRVIMRSGLQFRVVIGEGELDNAPMFAPDEVIGAGGKLDWDLAVDPLEGTYLCAEGLPGAVTAMAAGQPGTLLSAPDSYMRKVIAGPNCPPAAVDVETPLRELLAAVASGNGKSVAETVVCVLDKPRHQNLIEALRSAGAQLHLISDGDVPAAMWACRPHRFGVDLYLGVGGSPEGVLSAVATKALGGRMSARFEPQNPAQAERLAQWPGLTPNRIFSVNDLVKGDAVFAMATVTGTLDLAAPLQTKRSVKIAGMVISTRSKARQPRRFLREIDSHQNG